MSVLTVTFDFFYKATKDVYECKIGIYGLILMFNKCAACFALNSSNVYGEYENGEDIINYNCYGSAGNIESGNNLLYQISLIVRKSRSI